MSRIYKNLFAASLFALAIFAGIFGFALTASAQAACGAGGSPSPTTACTFPAYAQNFNTGANEPRYFATLADCQASGRPDVSRCQVGNVAQSQTRNILAQAWDGIKSTASDFAVGALDATIGRVVKWVANFIFWVAGQILTLSSSILDLAIEKSISSGILNNLTVIDIGWRIVRDVCNMFFIFVLLYVAIATIIDVGGVSAKRTLANVVVAALLINFSLLFGKIIIDAGNVVAIQFWNRMRVQMGNATVPSAGNWLMDGAKIQTVLDPESDMNKSSSGGLSQRQFAMMYLMGAVVMFILAYTFLFAAFLMAYRLVRLMILLILSPWAFLGLALPKGSYFDKWLDDIVSQSLVAPVFLMLLYLVVTVIRSSDLMVLTSFQGASFAAASSGSSPDSFVIFFNFLIIIILLLTVIEMTTSAAGKAGSFASKWAKNTIGFATGAAATGVGAVGRQTVGRYGNSRLKDEKWVKEQNRLVAKGGMAGTMANLKLATYGKAAKGSFDVRNAPMGGLGLKKALGTAGISAGDGSKRNYKETGSVGSSVVAMTGLGGAAVAKKFDLGNRGTKKEEELIKTAKDRFDDDGEAKKAYLERKGVDLSAERNKDIKKTINKEMAVSENKESLDKAVKDSEEHITDLERANKSLEVLTARRTALGDQVDEDLNESIRQATAHATEIRANIEEASKAAKKSLQNMSGEEVAKLMTKPKYRNNTVVTENLTSKDFSSINKMYQEQGYRETGDWGKKWGDNKDKSDGFTSGDQFIESITRKALTNKNTPENVKKLIKDNMKKGTWGSEIDFESEVAAIISSGKNADGSYAHKTTLTSEEQAKLKEYRSMLDNEDVASLPPSLLLHPEMVKEFRGSTLAAMNTKHKASGAYNDHADFPEKLTELLSEHGRPEARSYVNKNNSKEESLFYNQRVSTGRAQPNAQQGGGQQAGSATPFPDIDPTMV